MICDSVLVSCCSLKLKWLLNDCAFCELPFRLGRKSSASSFLIHCSKIRAANVVRLAGQCLNLHFHFLKLILVVVEVEFRSGL